MQQDVRSLLGAIRVPTLVLHRGDQFIRVDASRYLAQHIDGAKLVELPGTDNYFFVGDTDAFVDEIEEFLTGVRSGGAGDVVVSTILFTDIVDSTRQQATLGHRTWSRLSDDHDAMVRAALHRHRGHEVKTTGDGFLATFDSATRAIHCGRSPHIRNRQGTHNRLDRSPVRTRNRSRAQGCARHLDALRGRSRRPVATDVLTHHNQGGASSARSAL